MDGWKAKKQPPAAPLRPMKLAFRGELESLDAAFRAATGAADKKRDTEVPEQDTSLLAVNETIPDDSPPPEEHIPVTGGVVHAQDDMQEDELTPLDTPLCSDEEVAEITSTIPPEDPFLFPCCFCGDDTGGASQMCHDCKQKMKRGSLTLGKRARE